jgi:hypothetical protein
MPKERNLAFVPGDLGSENDVAVKEKEGEESVL